MSRVLLVALARQANAGRNGTLVDVRACYPPEQGCAASEEFTNKNRYTIRISEEVLIAINLSASLRNYEGAGRPSGYFEGVVDPIVTLPSDAFVDVEGEPLPVSAVFDVVYSENLPEPGAGATVLAALAALAVKAARRSRRRAG